VRGKLPRFLGLAILLAATFFLRNNKGQFLPLILSTFAILLFWFFHAISLTFSNLRTLFLILLIFMVPLFFLDIPSFFSPNLTSPTPWTAGSYDPGSTDRVELTHEVVFERTFDQRPTPDERYFKTGTLEQTDDGLHYQSKKTELQADKMPGAKKWADEHLRSTLPASEDALKDLFSRDFKYSLAPGRLSEPHPLDEFLFERKQGYCQHFAASVATLLKLSGRRARVVVGFAGGSYSPLTHVLSYEMADSHAWVETFEPETKRWVRIDPTSWVLVETPEPYDLSVRTMVAFLTAAILAFLFFAALKSRTMDPFALLHKKIWKFEKKQKLSPHGLTTAERLQRMIGLEPARANRVQETLKFYQEFYFRGAPTPEVKRSFRSSLNKW
jgi:hypothetical protein